MTPREILFKVHNCIEPTNQQCVQGINQALASLRKWVRRKKIYFQGNDSPQDKYREQRIGYNQALEDLEKELK